MQKNIYTEALPVFSVKEAIKVLPDYYELRAPVFLYGKPGVGKTSIAKALRANLSNQYQENFELITIYPSQLDNVDIKGVPTISQITIKRFDGENTNTEVVPITEWALPNFFPLEQDSRGILFLDECLLAPPSVRNAIMPLILEKEVNGRKLPSGWWPLAAGNRKVDGVDCIPMSAPMDNRFYLHAVIEPEPTETIEHFIKEEFDFRVVAFLREYPNYLHSMNNSKEVIIQAWASPRSWEFLSNFLKLPKYQNVDITELSKNIIGCIGPTIGNEFIVFCKYSYALPTATEILNNPKQAKLPDLSDNMTLGLLLTSLLINISVQDPENIEKCVSYLERYAVQTPPGLNHPLSDMAALYVQSVVKAHPAFITKYGLNSKSQKLHNFLRIFQENAEDISFIVGSLNNA